MKQKTDEQPFARLFALSPMRLWEELVRNILKVPVFVGWLFFILIRNFDFQIKKERIALNRKKSIFKRDYANMDKHALCNV